MATRIVWNSGTAQKYLDGGNGVEALLDREAQAALSRAKAIAPVLTGRYRDSLHIETDHTDRMVKRVKADAPHAHLVEAKHGTLAKALP